MIVGLLRKTCGKRMAYLRMTVPPWFWVQTWSKDIKILLVLVPWGGLSTTCSPDKTYHEKSSGFIYFLLGCCLAWRSYLWLEVKKSPEFLYNVNKLDQTNVGRWEVFPVMSGERRRLPGRNCQPEDRDHTNFSTCNDVVLYGNFANESDHRKVGNFVSKILILIAVKIWWRLFLC